MSVFFLLTEINYNICLCYEFESFPQNVNAKNIEICVNFFKENKTNHKHKNYALLHGAYQKPILGIAWKSGFELSI